MNKARIHGSNATTVITGPAPIRDPSTIDRLSQIEHALLRAELRASSAIALACSESVPTLHARRRMEPVERDCPAVEAKPELLSSCEDVGALLALVDAGFVLLSANLCLLAASPAAVRMLGPRLDKFQNPPEDATWEAEFRDRMLGMRQRGTPEVIDWVPETGSRDAGYFEIHCVPLGSGFAIVVRRIGLVGCGYEVS